MKTKEEVEKRLSELNKQKEHEESVFNNALGIDARYAESLVKEMKATQAKINLLEWVLENQ